ncbi:hypothetical protein [Joostella sp.]|uniref:hypothetical protein n=1 Tax=Joostella sp. TaxID=2231138 RepID=UPI003A904E16
MILILDDSRENCSNCIHAKDVKEDNFKYCTWHLEYINKRHQCEVYESIDEPMLQNLSPTQLDDYKKRINYVQKVYDMPEKFLKHFGYKTREDIYNDKSFLIMKNLCSNLY